MKIMTPRWKPETELTTYCSKKWVSIDTGYSKVLELFPRRHHIIALDYLAWGVLSPKKCQDANPSNCPTIYPDFELCITRHLKLFVVS